MLVFCFAVWLWVRGIAGSLVYGFWQEILNAPEISIWGRQSASVNLDVALLYWHRSLRHITARKSSLSRSNSLWFWRLLPVYSNYAASWLYQCCRAQKAPAVFVCRVWWPDPVPSLSSKRMIGPWAWQVSGPCSSGTLAASRLTDHQQGFWHTMLVTFELWHIYSDFHIWWSTSAVRQMGANQRSSACRALS